MNKWNKVGRQLRIWTASAANIAKAGYYAVRAWDKWEQVVDVAEWWPW
jgi:hypothetical protein